MRQQTMLKRHARFRMHNLMLANCVNSDKDYTILQAAR